MLNKKMIIGGVIAGVLLIGGMIFSLANYEYDPSVADNGNQDSLSAEAEAGTVDSSSLQ